MMTWPFGFWLETVRGGQFWVSPLLSRDLPFSWYGFQRGDERHLLMYSCVCVEIAKCNADCRQAWGLGELCSCKARRACQAIEGNDNSQTDQEFSQRSQCQVSLAVRRDLSLAIEEQITYHRTPAKLLPNLHLLPRSTIFNCCCGCCCSFGHHEWMDG